LLLRLNRGPFDHRRDGRGGGDKPGATEGGNPPPWAQTLVSKKKTVFRSKRGPFAGDISKCRGTSGAGPTKQGEVVATGGGARFFWCAVGG